MPDTTEIRVALAWDGRRVQRVALPKRFSLPMRELIMLQTRFERRSGRRALRLLEHPRFRAAYDFLLLRADAGEVDRELADWWTDLQEASDADRVAMVENRPAGESAGPAKASPTAAQRRAGSITCSASAWKS